jgi:hypothetical protein
MIWNDSPETASIRLECDGFTVDNYSIPPFCLKVGQTLCFHVLMPSPLWQEKLIPILTGSIAHPAVRLFGSVAYLDRPMPRRRWWGGWNDPPVRDWLEAEKGLSSAETTSILNRLALSPELRIGRTGWNERTMLALEACSLRPHDVLLLDTAGNDPRGKARIIDRLANLPPGVSLIYLKTRQEPDEPCLPRSECIAIAHIPLQTSVAE